jgi:Rieske Fe-S protein
MTDQAITRRSALSGVLVAVAGGVAGYVLASGSAAAKDKRGTTAANAYGASTGGGATLLAPLSSVPAGGGVILTGKSIVLTRTSTGVHAFSSICTHQGCPVGKVSAGTIDCPCHGSRFDAATGAVVSGPAPRPLPKVAITVRDGSVYTS